MVSDNTIDGSSIVSELKKARVNFVIALPDIVTCDGLLWPISRDPDFQLITICKEDEGVSICSGLSYSENRAVLMMQHTGFLDSINSIRAMGMDYQLPIIMLVGLQGLEPDSSPNESSKNGVRIIIPMLELMQIDFHILDKQSDVPSISDLIDSAYNKSSPYVFLVTRAPL
jgi:sulfopyruvate decarboxylase TPP-binding subunit